MIVLAVILGLAATKLPTFQTPAGMAYVHGRPNVPDAASMFAGTGLAQGPAHIATTPGYWLEIRVQSGASFAWPKGDTLTAILDDGSRVKCIEQWAVGEGQRLAILRLQGVVVNGRMKPGRHGPGLQIMTLWPDSIETRMVRIECLEVPQ